MVAASRLRRAQERIQTARPFAIEMLRVLNSLATRVDPAAHPLLDQRPAPRAGGKALLFVITADRGLCGSFNTNAIKGAGNFIVENPAREVALGLVGRRGRDYFARRGFEVRYEQVNLFQALQYSHAQGIAQAAVEAFTTGQVDSVYLVYNEFKSIMTQKVVVEQLLPIPRAGFAADLASAGHTATSAGSNLDVDRDGRIDEGSAIEYLYEPDPVTIFAELLPYYVQIQIFHALLESAAAEHAARMTAMEAATKNSAEMLDNLTLYMNKVRQAAITREIIEVVSGAGAL